MLNIYGQTRYYRHLLAQLSLCAIFTLTSSQSPAFIRRFLGAPPLPLPPPPPLPSRPATPEETRYFTNTKFRKIYFYSADGNPTTFNDAKLYCARNNGSILQINSPQENSFIAENVPAGGTFWVGVVSDSNHLHRHNHRQSRPQNPFNKVDGSPLRWANTQGNVHVVNPNSKPQFEPHFTRSCQAVKINTRGRWQTVNCDDYSRPLCEVQLDERDRPVRHVPISQGPTGHVPNVGDIASNVAHLGDRLKQLEMIVEKHREAITEMTTTIAQKMMRLEETVQELSADRNATRIGPENISIDQLQSIIRRQLLALQAMRLNAVLLK